MEVILRLVEDGGPVIVLLFLLSLTSLTVTVWRVIELWGVGGGRERRDAAIASWGAGERDGAVAALQGGRSPADRVTLYAMESLRQGLRGPMLEAEIARRGNEEVAAMSKGIRFLELIAMIGPLLGLLGTVLGMIESFRMLAAAEGTANASVLAGGIWEALITTAAGLIVAIPAAVGASFLASRVDVAALRIEGSVGRLLLVDGGGAAAQAA
jgi:biopolymer transport protein ExbB